MKKSFLIIFNRGLQSITFQLYHINNNVPKLIADGPYNNVLTSLREFTLKQLVRLGIVAIPQDERWDLIQNINITIVDGSNTHVSVEAATEAEWGDSSVLASWLMDCDEDDIRYIVEESERLDMYYEDIIDYLKGADLPLTGENYIAEMQRLLIRRANQELNPQWMEDVDDVDDMSLTLEKNTHYLINSDLKSNFIIPKIERILKDFVVNGYLAVEMLQKWKGREQG